MPRSRRDHYLSRAPRDDRADPWISDGITRPPGTEHIYRAMDEAEARDFTSALYKSARHHKVSLSARPGKDAAGLWVVTYRLWPKHVGQAHIKTRKANGEGLAYDKLTEE